MRRLNGIRRENPALQRVENVVVLETQSEHLLAYAKAEAGNVVICVVNLDPVAEREGLAIIPSDLGLPSELPAQELLTGAAFRWRTGRNYVRLGPGQSHIVRIA